MLSEATIKRELRAVTLLWKTHKGGPDAYEMLRGAEFALAWVLEGAVSGTKVSALIEAYPQMAADIQRVLDEGISR